MSAAYSAASAAFIESEPASAADRALALPVPALGVRSQPAGSVLLRNVGGKPLRLRADLLAEGSSRASNLGFWHELALYRTDSGQIAVALRLLRAGVRGYGLRRHLAGGLRSRQRSERGFRRVGHADQRRLRHAEGRRVA